MLAEEMRMGKETVEIEAWEEVQKISMVSTLVNAGNDSDMMLALGPTATIRDWLMDCIVPKEAMSGDSSDQIIASDSNERQALAACKSAYVDIVSGAHVPCALQPPGEISEQEQ